MIRGSGPPEFGDQKKFIRRLFRQLQKQGKDPDRDIALQVVNWYEPLATEQQTLISRLMSSDLK